MCLTRRYHDLVVARQASGQRLKGAEISYYAIEYLTVPECIRVRHETNLARRGSGAESLKDQAAIESSCQKEAGVPLKPSL